MMNQMKILNVMNNGYQKLFLSKWTIHDEFRSGTYLNDFNFQ